MPKQKQPDSPPLTAKQLRFYAEIDSLLAKGTAGAGQVVHINPPPPKKSIWATLFCCCTTDEEAERPNPVSMGYKPLSDGPGR